MSKQDMLKVQTCILKVDIRCACKGCEDKVSKRLQKVDGVYLVSVDAEQGKVIVTGNNVDPAKLIHKLKSSGKHAELWGGAAQKGNNMMPNNLQIENNRNSQNRGGGGGVHHVPVQMKGEGGNSQQKPGGDKKESKSGGGGVVGRFLGFGGKSKKGGGEADTNIKNGGGGGGGKLEGHYFEIPAEGRGENRGKSKNGNGPMSQRGPMGPIRVGDFPGMQAPAPQYNPQWQLEGHDFDIPAEGGSEKVGKSKNGNGWDGPMGHMGPRSQRDPMGPIRVGDFPGMQVPAPQYNPHMQFEGHDFDIPGKSEKRGKGKNGNGGDGPMGHMGPVSLMGPMGQIPVGDYPGMHVPAPHYNPQQQYMDMMMNQQQAAANMNNNRLYPESQPQGMGYMPHPSMGYMPPPPMPSHTMANPVTHVFSDYNTESCSIM